LTEFALPAPKSLRYSGIGNEGHNGQTFNDWGVWLLGLVFHNVVKGSTVQHPTVLQKTSSSKVINQPSMDTRKCLPDQSNPLGWIISGTIKKSVEEGFVRLTQRGDHGYRG